MLDPIYCRAFYLENENQKLLFVSLDTIGATEQFRHDIVARVQAFGIPEDHIFISGTHTHNGPGALSTSKFWQLLAMDEFQPEIYNTFLDGVTAAIETAVLSRQEANLLATSFDAEGLQTNRRDADDPVDPSANLLLARSPQGDFLGGIINFAIHGTALGIAELRFSSDVPGKIAADFESALAQRNSENTQQPIVLFINGAEGDVAPAKEGISGIAEIGASFTRQALDAFGSLRPIEASWSVSSKKVLLRKPRLSFYTCMKGIKVGPIRLPWWMGARLGAWVGREASISKLVLGDMIMLAWPGEPTSSLGFLSKKIMGDFGASQAWNLGLTNDHLAYFVDFQEYFETSYEACTSFFGPDVGERLISGFIDLLREP